MDTKSYPAKYVLSRYTFLGGGAGGFGLALFIALLFRDTALLDEIFAYSVYGIFIGMIPSCIAGALMVAFRVRRGVKGTLASVSAFLLPGITLLLVLGGSDVKHIMPFITIFYGISAIFAGIALSFLLPTAKGDAPPQAQNRP